VNIGYKKILIVLLWSTLALPSLVNAATGFVDKSIWLSNESPKEGDTISIYTALFNSDAGTFSGKVAFYDGSIILDTKDFSIAGRMVGTISTDWKVTAGDHALRAEVIDPTVTADGKKQSVYLGDAKTPEYKLTVKKTIIQPPVAAPAPTSTTGTSSIISKIPTSVSAPVVSAATAIDTWRADTGAAFSDKKDAIQKEIDGTAKNSVATISVTSDGKAAVAPTSDTLKTPVAYAKLFFFQAAAFVFQNKIIFYGLCVLILFLVGRSIRRRSTDK
jgi:hypothetical protein